MLLFAFAFAMAGVNPVAVSGVGKMMSTASMGIMLPLAGIGSIVMPWIIRLVADHIGLPAGMFCNLVPCIGILVLSLAMTRMKEQSCAVLRNKASDLFHQIHGIRAVLFIHLFYRLFELFFFLL